MHVVTKYDEKDYDLFRQDITNEKVIEILKHIRRGYLPDYNYTGAESDYENFKLHMAISKAIEVLEKIAIE